MRAVVQRVTRAKCTVENEITGEIKQGLVVLLGIARDDSKADADYLASRVASLRIFDDEVGKMNLSVKDVAGALLVVSQFTLYGDARKGRRPSFIEAAAPDEANRLYEFFVAEARKQLKKVETGRFQAMMKVELVNDGPVTILLDSHKNF